jgi:6,7-dimethyl-8-ribityllumazine synthase
MQGADQGRDDGAALVGEGLRIGIVRARFNDAITRKLAEACLAELERLEVDGETYHFELVCNESGAGVSRVALDHSLPVANAILTVETEEQAWARAEEKGRDAARVAVEMANLMEDLS